MSSEIVELHSNAEKIIAIYRTSGIVKKLYKVTCAFNKKYPYAIYLEDTTPDERIGYNCPCLLGDYDNEIQRDLYFEMFKEDFFNSL